MRFPNILLGLLATVITGTAAVGDCDSGPWAQRVLVGDKNDRHKADIEICETQFRQNAVVNGIQVWSDKNRITGYVLSYSNGDVSHLIGSKDGDKYQTLKWDAKLDKVTRAALWSDWDATQLGGLLIELSNGASLEAKIDRISAVKFEAEVGGGVLLGAFGRADGIVTALGWLFLENKVNKIRVTDFKWDEDQEEFVKKEK
jgi:hypothetical protein